MTPRKRRKARLLGKKRLLFFLCLIGLVGSAGIGIRFFLSQDRPLFVSPLSQSGLNIMPKGTVQKEKEITNFLSQNHLILEEISRSSDSAIIVKLKDNGEIYLSEENYSRELPSLQRIVSQLTMEGKRFTRLDLRFQRPIIVL